MEKLDSIVLPITSVISGDNIKYMYDEIYM